MTRLVLLALAACATPHPLPTTLPAPLPASSWSGEVWLSLLGLRTPADNTVCESAVVQPAVDCGAGVLDFDDCHWRCEPRAGRM